MEILIAFGLGVVAVPVAGVVASVSLMVKQQQKRKG